MAAPDPHWLAALQQRASQPPLQPRLALLHEGRTIGSAQADLLMRLHAELHDRQPPVLAPLPDHTAWTLLGPAQDALAALAALMRELGLAGAWRNEQLAVEDARGLRVATVERAAVRPLGIGTRAVHLIGLRTDGAVWVQQRAWNKANDPGLWDTLMGGMVSAADDTAQALARETWEEAGLGMDQLLGLRHGGLVHIRQPAADASGAAGYMDERIDWFVATLADGAQPLNRDGEVARFECLTRDALLQRLHADAFTLEAALVLSAWLAQG